MSDNASGAFDGVRYICPDCGIERVDANTPQQVRLCPACHTLAKPFLEVRPPRVLPPTEVAP